MAHCIDCQKSMTANWQGKHLERYRQSQKRYAKSEKGKKTRKRWWDEHRTYWIIYYQKNKERIKKNFGPKYSKKWRLENRNYIKARRRAIGKTEADKKNAYRRTWIISQLTRMAHDDGMWELLKKEYVRGRHYRTRERREWIKSQLIRMAHDDGMWKILTQEYEHGR